jgi:hypothetical protein
MNERIRQLAEQAFFDESTSRPSTKMYTFSEHKMEKFAELIVQECVGVADHLNITGKSIIGQRIKEHFGVEE